MSEREPQDAAPPPGPGPGGAADSPDLATRIAFGATLVLLAVLLSVSARSGTVVDEERVGQRFELVELIRTEEARAEQLATRVEELAAEVDALEQASSVEAETVAAVQERIDAIAAPAGMTEVRGPGVVTELNDSSLSDAPSGDINDLVIHEEDLQGVINALWAGGAEAMSVNGERILATTAIRCVGNTLLLHGAVYSPPYIIEAVGDADALLESLAADSAVQRFATTVNENDLGYDVAVVDELLLPAYEGVPGLQVARPAAAAER